MINRTNHWLPEYTSELINVLNVLGMLVELESRQADILDSITGGALISVPDTVSGQESSG